MDTQRENRSSSRGIRFVTLIAALAMVAALAWLQLADDTVPRHWQQQVGSLAGRRARLPYVQATFRGEFVRDRLAHPPPIPLVDVQPHPRLGWPWAYRDWDEMQVYEFGDKDARYGTAKPGRMYWGRATVSLAACLALVIAAMATTERLAHGGWRFSLGTFLVAVSVVGLALAATPFDRWLGFGDVERGALATTVRVLVYAAVICGIYQILATCLIARRASVTCRRASSA